MKVEKHCSGSCATSLLTNANSLPVCTQGQWLRNEVSVFVVNVFEEITYFHFISYSSVVK
jgi:hypothetical protein